MSRPVLHVIIIGGGIGGLCLAQGLKRNGVSVAVYERDESPDARLQGYRLNIEPVGSRALYDCLPTELWNLLVATAGDPGPRMGVFDEQLHQLMQEDALGAVSDPASAHHAVSRVTLRRLLLAGLDGVVHFNKQFVRYESSQSGTVTAFFSDGTSAAGTLLVGADGARSRVRRQLLPQAHDVEVPAVGIGGKLLLDRGTMAWLPEHLQSAKNMILPPRDFLFTAAFRRRPGVPSGILATERLRQLGLNLNELAEVEDRDYIMWAFVAHRKSFPAERADPLSLRQAIERRMEGWHPILRRLVSQSDPQTVQAFDFSAAARVKPWATGNVTLLGDALHHMPPVGGMGGNAALHDANLLCRALALTENGDPLQPVLRRCEAAMISHGFTAVNATRLYTKLAISRFPLMRTSARLFFKTCGRSGTLRRAVFSGA